MSTKSASTPMSLRLLLPLVLAIASVSGIVATNIAPAAAQITPTNSPEQGLTPGSTVPNSTEPAQDQETTLQTGDIQITLRWDSEDDLDLYVKPPSGEVLSFFNRKIASGGQFDVDANSGCQVRNQTPFENVFWPVGSGVPGDYTVTVQLYNDCGSGTPVNFTLDVLTYGELQTYAGTLSVDQDSARFPFSLPGEPAD